MNPFHVAILLAIGLLVIYTWQEVVTAGRAASSAEHFFDSQPLGVVGGGCARPQLGQAHDPANPWRRSEYVHQCGGGDAVTQHHYPPVRVVNKIEYVPRRIRPVQVDRLDAEQSYTHDPRALYWKADQLQRLNHFA